MINETGVFFFPGGGHSHDGQNSSFIDVTAYSVFDFEWSTSLGGPDRVRRLDRNYTAFREFIINTVNQSILNPAGIFYQPGSINGSSHIISSSITANEIQAGTITGNLLNANVVLVNQIIASNNYVAGVSGWAIDGDGTAEFSNSIFRGTVVTSNIAATGGTIGGWNISSDLISSAGGDIALYADDVTGSLVAGTNANNQISLLSDGSLSAVASNIETTINVPYIFGGNSFTFIVKSVSTPLNAVRISPSRVITTTASNQITLDANDGINTNLGIIAGGQIQGDTIYSDGTIYAGDTGVYYNTSNLPGSRFGMSFGWDSPIAAVSFIVNNDTNVDGYILPDGFYSDRRIKSNISLLSNELLEKIYSIKTYEFDYNDSIPHESLRGKHDIGVIADELELLFPEIVINKEDPEKYKQVLYIKTIPLLLGVIGDLNTRLKALEQQLGYNS